MDNNFISHNHKLKYIFSNYFFQYWDDISSFFSEDRKDNILYNINSFLHCADPNFGFSQFLCTSCLHKFIQPFSCKSKFCPSCGKIYAENWASSLDSQLLNVSHIHMTFSLPTGFIRNFFFNNQHLLKELSDATYSSIKYSFKKIGIYNLGVITNIHTFSRDISWNPHIHAIVTFGGFDIKGNWKTPKSLPWKPLRKSWQKCSLDIISTFAKYNNSITLKNKISIAYRKYSNGFYVNSNNIINNIHNIAKYLGRYLARPAIAEYRITFFDSKNITFWYQKPDNDDKIFITLSLRDFFGRLVSHIAPKYFKMIRRYGIYSRNNKTKKIKILRFNFFRKKLSWVERIYRDFKRNPLYCPKCGTSMILIGFYTPKYGFHYAFP